MSMNNNPQIENTQINQCDISWYRYFGARFLYEFTKSKFNEKLYEDFVENVYTSYVLNYSYIPFKYSRIFDIRSDYTHHITREYLKRYIEFTSGKIKSLRELARVMGMSYTTNWNTAFLVTSLLTYYIGLYVDIDFYNYKFMEINRKDMV